MLNQWPAGIYQTSVKVIAHLERTGNLFKEAYPQSLLPALCDSLLGKTCKCQHLGETLPFGSHKYD